LGKILIEKLETIKAEKGKKLHIVDFEDNKNKVAYSLKCLINN